MLRRILAGKQRGDTIVEVMIVLTVLGLAIGISYATANRSLLDVRQAQENSQAAERVQAQVENLLSMSGNLAVLPNGNPNPDYIFGYTSPQLFCVNSGHVATTSTAMPNASCQYDGLYNITISYQANLANPPGVVGGTFTIIATWPDVEGQGADTATLSYRVYQL